MHFEFATANQVIFSPGSLREIGLLAKRLGRRALVVAGRTEDRSRLLQELLVAEGVEFERFALVGEPTTEAVTKAVEQARAGECELVIGFGGGSALDAAKAVSGMLTNGGELLDYLEVVGQGRPLARAAAPCIAVPTTAGTGAEVTRNAVLQSPSHKVKVSLRSPHILPRVALVDPQLTLSVPPTVTAATGMDALTQLIEPYVCIRANPLTDAVCVEGMKRAARSLRKAYENGTDLAAREDMSVASLFSGLALANAGLGAVHGFAAPIGGMYPAPHGAVCAALLPWVMAVNVQALRARAPQSEALKRYDEVGRLLTGQFQATADDGVAWARRLCADLGIPALRQYGLSGAAAPVLVQQARRASSMKANPIALADEELAHILEQAI